MTGARQGTGDGLEECAHLAIDDDSVETFLAAEVLIDNWLRNARALRDLLHRGGVESLLGKQRSTDVEQLLTPLLAGHAHPSVTFRIVFDPVQRNTGRGVRGSPHAAILSRRHRCARRASRRSCFGHRTSYAHPNVSNNWMTRAPESI